MKRSAGRRGWIIMRSCAGSAAQSSGLADLSARFRDVETMLATNIALNVVGALTDPLVDERHRPLVRQLEMVAMNLKNLRNDGPSTR
jgi:hypothetical protein